MTDMYFKRLFDYYRAEPRDDGDVWTRIVDGDHIDKGNEFLRFITRKEGVRAFLEKSKKTAPLWKDTEIL